MKGKIMEKIRQIGQIGQMIARLLPARRLVVVQKIQRESDEVLETLLAQGPEAHAWRGMDECAWRLMQRWEDEATGSLEDKGLAIVRSQAVMELRGEMLAVYYARQKKVQEKK